jgi:hypothetical protein
MYIYLQYIYGDNPYSRRKRQSMAHNADIERELISIMLYGEPGGDKNVGGGRKGT